MIIRAFILIMLLLFLRCYVLIAQSKPNIQSTTNIKAINEDDLTGGDREILIQDITILNGNSEPIYDGVVFIKNNLIEYVGKPSGLKTSNFDELIEGNGKTLLPGFIDSHFHYDDVREIPSKFVKNGVTSVRDPGEWFSSYDIELNSGLPLPRLFLTGPHLEVYPSLFPEDAFTIGDAYEARRGVVKLYEMGSSAIKIYSRTPAGMIKEICDQASKLGIPVTAHLDATEAMEAIKAGLDGIEHITSFTQSLMSPREAEQFKQSVLGRTKYLQSGAYQEIWSAFDLKSDRAVMLVKEVVKSRVFVTPTLAAMEYQLNEKNQDSTKLKGFRKMMEFTGMLISAGANVVVGSHGPWVPYAERGWSFQREMELLSQCEMKTMDIIRAATIDNARFFRIDDRLGTIEAGKQADLVILEGNPLEDIKAIYEVHQVMLNGIWVARE